MDKMTLNNQTAEPIPPAQNTPPTTPQKKLWDVNRWPFFILFSLGAFIFWIFQLAYQYFVFAPQDTTTALVVGSAYAGTTLIAAALFSSAVFKWFPTTAQNWRVRRFLGVSGHIFIVFHTTAVLFLIYGGNYKLLFFTFNPLQNPIIFGAIAYAILWVMAITSFDWAQKKLGKQWKFIHRFIYIAWPASILHYFLMSYNKPLTLPRSLLLFATALTVFGQLFWFFKTIVRRKFKNAGTYVGFAIIIGFVILLILGIQFKNQ